MDRTRTPTSRLPANILDRTPPADLEAESATIGSILLSPEAGLKVFRLLRPGDFHDAQHATMYRALLEAHSRGEPTDDHRLLLAALGDDPTFRDRDELITAIARVAKSVPTAAHAEHYARIVRFAAAKRQIAGVAEGLLVSAHNGEAPTDILSRLRADIDDIERGGGTTDAEPVSIGDLITDNPHLAEPVVDGIVRRTETASAIAAPKSGKSWFAYGLALSVATGRPWLDTFVCRRGRVLIIDNELHAATLAHRIPTVADALELREADYSDRLDVLSLRGHLTDLHGISRLLERRGEAYDLVILDSLYRAMPAGTSENDNAAVAALYNTIDRLAGKLGCAWLNVHHASKGSQSEKGITDVGAGAGAQSRAVDAHLILRPHEEDGCAVLDGVVRSFAPMDPLPLRWTFPVWRPAGDLDPEALAGRKTRQEERQDERDREGMDQVVEALGQGPATAREIRRRIGGMGLGRADRLIDRLVADGAISSRETIRRGNPCMEYGLVGDVVRQSRTT